MLQAEAEALNVTEVAKDSVEVMLGSINTIVSVAIFVPASPGLPPKAVDISDPIHHETERRFRPLTLDEAKAFHLAMTTGDDNIDSSDILYQYHYHDLYCYHYLLRIILPISYYVTLLL